MKHLESDCLNDYSSVIDKDNDNWWHYLVAGFAILMYINSLRWRLLKCCSFILSHRCQNEMHFCFLHSISCWQLNVMTLWFNTNNFMMWSLNTQLLSLRTVRKEVSKHIFRVSKMSHKYPMFGHISTIP